MSWLDDGNFSLRLRSPISRALDLGRDSPEAYAAKGLALWTTGRYEEAQEPFEHAVTLGPTLFEAHLFYGRNCRVQEEHEKAARLFERAAELQPNDFKSLGLAVDAYRSLGRQADMLSATRRCVQRISAEVTEHPDNAHALAFGAVFLAELRDQARAEDWATRAVMIDPADATLKYNLVCTYIALGQLEVALDWLQKIAAESAASRPWFAKWMSHDSSIDPLRDHPRFQCLARGLETDDAHSTRAAPPTRRAARAGGAGGKLV